MVSVPPPLKVKLPILTVPPNVVPVDEVDVKLPLPVKAPKLIAPLPALNVDTPFTAVLPNVMPAFVVLTVPERLVVPAVEVRPLVKFMVPLKLTPPVLVNVIALLIVLLLPLKVTL